MAASAKDELGNQKSVFLVEFFFKLELTNERGHKECLINTFVCFLELLERVFLRVASAETDEQLEKTVKIFLCPLLLKVASPHQEVKNKVSIRKCKDSISLFAILEYFPDVFSLFQNNTFSLS